MNFENATIIDSNGTKYRVGWDEYGWFTIQRLERYGDELQPSDDPLVSLPPDKLDDVIELMEERI